MSTSSNFNTRRRNVPAKQSSRLTLTMPSEREVVLTRVFDAPRSLVFDALTKCEHLKHW
jgi:hypothetical protein